MGITLRPVEASDAKLIAKWYNDKENARFMSTLVRTRYHKESDIEREFEDIDDEYERLFMVMEDGNPEPIGHAGIDDMDLHDRRGEIFFMIGDKNARGKGYAKQIVKELLEYAFVKLGFNSVFATAAVENKPSIAVLEKGGFKRFGVRREYNFYPDAGYMDELFFDITLGDWKKQNEGIHKHNK